MFLRAKKASSTVDGTGLKDDDQIWIMNSLKRLKFPTYIVDVIQTDLNLTFFFSSIT